MNFEERYKALNSEQKMAVDKIDGPLLVVAGPGSGKTEILSLRVGKILKDTDTRASNILCLTFTESATLNMRKRLASLIGSEAYRVAIHTFHNFCVDVIQKYPQYFYSGAFFSSADPLTQVQIMEEIFENLSHNHLLSSYHPEQGFVYLKSTLDIIGYLKKAGLTPDEFKAILGHNKKSLDEINKILMPIFSERMGKESVLKIAGACEKIKVLAEKSQTDFPTTYFNSLYFSVAESLKKALDEAEDSGKATPLSAWKQKWMKKDDEDRSIFKDTVNIEKMLCVADIYAKYRKTMHEKGYYDFDDMILDVLKAFEENPSLRYEIQEQYQYVLVDEFQDTNEAQMRLLRLISDAPVNEGRPNIMAVGDDDQAVYKFQGAELSNILNFKKIFKDVQVVAMTKNYRSTQDILDIASHIIRKGEERLEKLLPEIEKNLIASNKDIKQGNIVRKEFKTVAHEYHFISREIKKKIDAGEKPEEIAVIARKHRQLEALVPYLRGVGVPIRYEREQNVFKEPHIAQLIIIARFISSLADKNKDEADEFMPQILSFPFWNLNREDVWKISLEARKNYPEKTWLEVMLAHKNEKIKKIAEFLIDLGVRAQSEPLELILDEIIGAHLLLVEENEDDDEDEFFAAKNSSVSPAKFESPFREFYFNKEKFNHARAEYLSFLSSLRVFVGALREYKSGEILSIKDLVEFVDLHEQNDISLNDSSPFAKLDNAVNLLTAHKAKGLEFESVFVLSCQDDIWARGGASSRLVLPANLPIEPAGDTQDDQLRLFYVALTRAKRHLYITSYLTEEGGKEAEMLRFLIAESGEEEVMKKEVLKKIYFESESVDDEVVPDAHEVLTASWLQYHTPPFVGSEEKLLKSLLTDYQMPVTHLNNFLDVEKGGPQYFLEQNLLRFPQAKNTSSSYGSAIHHTLEKVSLFLKKEGEMSKIPEVLSWFKYFLIKERMSPKDFEKYLEKGQDDLGRFLENKNDRFSPKDIVEFNFKEQGVKIGDAHLTGKIDRIIDEDGEYKVCDYKTGKPLLSWTSGTDYEKTKAMKYERQLAYYKLLLENSREFAGKGKVKTGVLEFIEPKNSKILDLNLILDDEKVENLKKLIEVVYNKIINLDFPDVTKYSKDTKGIKQFEEDLIEEKV